MSERASRLPPGLTVLIGLLLVLAVAALDYVTGYEVSASIFYLIPVSYVTWYAGCSHGMLVAVISAAMWGIVAHAAGARDSTPLIPVWNSAVRLGFFAVTAGLLGELSRTYQTAQAMAHTDSLTGVHSVRSFYLELDREIQRLRRYGRPFALAYSDQ